MTSFVVRAALLAGLGMVALTVPAGAASTASGITGSDVRTAQDTMQVAQRSEERGGSFKKKSKKKKKAKKMS
jgi:hypothetical protein